MAGADFFDITHIRLWRAWRDAGGSKDAVVIAMTLGQALQTIVSPQCRSAAIGGCCRSRRFTPAPPIT